MLKGQREVIWMPVVEKADGRGEAGRTYALAVSSDGRLRLSTAGAEEMFPFARRVTRIQAGEELGCLYVFERDPRRHDVRPVLAELHRARVDRKTVLEFPVLDEEGSARVVGELDLSPGADQVLGALESRAIGVTTLRYSTEDDRLVLDETYRVLQAGRPTDDVVTVRTT